MASSLRAADLKSALACLAQIGQGSPTPGEFARRGVKLLPGLVASEITTLSVCDLKTGRRRVVSAPVHVFGRDALAAFDRHFFEHPLVRFHASTPAGGVHRISDSFTQAAFRATPLYADYYAKVGLRHALALPLHVDSRLLVSFVFNRSGRNFSDVERELLEIVRPNLAMLYRQACTLAEVQRARTTTGEPSVASGTDAMGFLTPREREVLGWVAAGKSNAQIGTILGAMPRTVAKHLERIYEKLGVESRTAAAMKAVAAAQVSPE